MPGASRRAPSLLFRLLLLCLLPLGAVGACGDDDGGATPDAGPADAAPSADAPEWAGFRGPDDVCPGASHCQSAGDGTLYVGVAKIVMTPEITETWTDVDGDDNFDLGEPYVDADGDGTFDGYWLF